MSAINHYNANPQVNLDSPYYTTEREQERQRLPEGEIAGLKVSIDDPNTQGELKLNKGVEFIQRFEGTFPRQGQMGMLCLAQAYVHLQEAHNSFGLDQALGPLNAIDTFVNGMRQGDDVANPLLERYILGEPRDCLIAAADQLKIQYESGDETKKPAYDMSLALLKLNNYH